MAKQRLINTKFWSDSWIVNLDPTEKLLFLYLLTNERTNICGIYELPLKFMATETGIEKEMVEKVLKRFTKDKKIYFINGWIVIKNFIKNQNQGSPKVKTGIETELSKISAEILDKIKELDKKSKGIDTLSHLNLNLNPNLNLNSIVIRDFTLKIMALWNDKPTGKNFPQNALNRSALKKLLPNCRQITPDIEKVFSGLKKYTEYTEDDFKKAIMNYCVEILNRNPTNDYSKHRFSFYEFFKQKNGFIKFLNK
ncbi:MAG: hypothetical protein AAB706_02315 [Patescibacteria group bacterium]